MAKTKSAAVTVLPMQKEVASVETIISQAIEKGVALDQMERFLDMRDRVLKDQARAAFVQAMAQFQADCPVIEKTKKVLNKDQRTVRYVYAPMDAITTQIQKPLAAAQLSYRFETVQETGGKEIKAICHVTHTLGHTESSYFIVPVDPEGYMTAPQKLASALTFAKRYALLNALGITTGDEDTDAVDVKKEPDVKSLKSKVMFLLKGLKVKAATAPEISVEVERLTGLKLNDENLEDIVTKLEEKLRAQNADISVEAE